MNLTVDQIIACRLAAHHLDQPLPPQAMVQAAGACGLQNSPPGAWETALFNRLEGCTLAGLHRALYEEKALLQAWSFRGAPVVFPTAQRHVFLTPLMARPGESPWIYTLGITAALDHLGMEFDDLLCRVKQAAGYLDAHTVTGKDALDSALAAIVEDGLPQDKKPLWRDQSMYAPPGRQTVGGATVSFLLRPCAFSGLVVFGRRAGVTPAFTSFKNWTGLDGAFAPGGDRALVRKFLTCYGPSTPQALMGWLGCSRPQAQRLWAAVAGEIEPVAVAGKTRYILQDQRESLLRAQADPSRLLLLGAHDPYLDLRDWDRRLILPDSNRHRSVWKTVGNPGVILRGGRILGIWKSKTVRDALHVDMQPFEALSTSEEKALKDLAQQYAAFRLLALKGCRVAYGQ